jgi:L-alanine-DL-glutamate epimerase-like enolase superfamily enzyme
MHDLISGSGPAKLNVRIVRLKLKHPWTLSRNSSAYKENVIVTIDKNGITGFGEAAPNIRYGENAKNTLELIQDGSNLYSDFDFSQYELIGQKMCELIPDNSCARAALDIALMDWLGKAYQKPLYKFLNINKGEIPTTSFSIGIDQPDMIRTKIDEAAGFKILKVKLGTDKDEEIINTIREKTNKPIRVDANEGWKDKQEALDKISWLQSKNVELVEQPMPADLLEEAAWLQERTTLPLIADEAVKTVEDIPRLSECYDGINIKLMKAGGIQEALRMIYMAKKFGLKIMLGCMIESSVAISAALHLAPLADYVDLDGYLLINNDPFTGIRLSQGQFILPEQPGLGVTEKSI